MVLHHSLSLMAVIPFSVFSVLNLNLSEYMRSCPFVVVKDRPLQARSYDILRTARWFPLIATDICLAKVMNDFAFHKNMERISFRAKIWRDSYGQKQNTIQENNLSYFYKEQGRKYCTYTASKDILTTLRIFHRSTDWTIWSGRQVRITMAHQMLVQGQMSEGYLPSAEVFGWWIPT